MLIGNQDAFFPDMVTDVTIDLSDHPIRYETLIGTVYTSQSTWTLADCIYTVVRFCRRTYEYLYISAMYFRCYSVVAAAAVRHRVPDGKNCCCGSLHLIRVLFLFIQTRFICNIPLGSTVAFTASVYQTHTINPRYNCGHARSQGGRPPGAANIIYTVSYTHLTLPTKA